jgi:transposase InsO family protein
MDYCSSHGIKMQFSKARTPQQNGVVERKNMTVQEMARTMLMDSKLTYIFWTQEVYTTVHIQNRVMLRNNIDKTPYELWKGRPTNVKHFRGFGSKRYIKREDAEWESLNLMWTKDYLLVTQVQGNHTSFRT